LLPYAALHTSTRPEVGAQVPPVVPPDTTAVFRTSELLQSADAAVRYDDHELDRFLPRLTVNGLD
jgi:hypothetical protein